MKRSFLYIILSVIILIFFQLFFGNISPNFFRFPLNILLACLWIIILIYQSSFVSKNLFTKNISSSNFSIAIIVTFSLSLLILGFVKQDKISNDPLGLHNFTTTTIFVGILILFITNLILVSINYLKKKRSNRLRFFLIHFGLICSIGASFLGISDQEVYRIKTSKDKIANYMYDSEGNTYNSKYKIKLLDLNTEHYSNGNISKCSGIFLIDNKKTIIEINSPYSPCISDDIYMVSYNRGNSDNCILEIVRQPWKYMIFIGIIMTIMGAFMLFINGPKIKEGELK